ncbi:peroxisomal N(1)-acetyl-spermine/spermidine oxidase-like isoform X1 [Astyanax mexicanus]|uniref:Peroxisomal N(1)-acetyl-spermine/spermidine oxidase-like isoform X1 n=2 Tax=Astyanax mexicanus TaxID=7994 RepID=A0A8T2LFQ3_ASTMX|nr:peroxisomal N(1)-acetyl-spermine/spermidine oxidase-like isoform X1 [Astyanax mexicanus]
MKTSRQPRIVVVGAGVAGLGAATRLKELGFTDLTVVEASDTVGGRVAKSKIGKVWVDTGAQYIHGASVENPIYCLLNTSGLLSQVPPDEGSTVYYRRDGQRLSEDLADRVYEAGEGIFRQRGNNSGRSLGEHFAEAAQAFVEGWQAEEKKSVQGVLALVGKDYLINIAASDLHRVSVDSWQYYTNMGDDLNVEGCMFQMVEKLAEDVPKERLLLNKAVSKIEWDGSFSGTDSQVYPVRVLCGDGGEILADHVIVTVSLGCLKAQAASLFSPSLPAEKMEVIDKLSFGNIAKIFLEYEEAFWESDVSRISLIWDDDSVESVSTNKTQWLKHVSLFTVMKPQERFGNILIGWCPGDVADLIETMTEEELSSAITEHLRIFTGNLNIPPPKSVLQTRWRRNNFTHGSYTYIPVGVDGQVMDVLAQPLVGIKNPSKDLQVLFSGEATIKTQYSTVQGALLSGHRDAERLAQLYGRTAPPAVHCNNHI